MNRRFLYMVATNSRSCSYTLHRIKPSQLFYPKGAPDCEAAVVEECCLPTPTASFYPPQSRDGRGRMEFMLFGSNRNKIVGTDQTGRSLLYDDGLRAIRTLPSLSAPKCRSVPLAIGDSLYVLEAIPMVNYEKQHQSFEALKQPSELDVDDLFWHSLPPPPYVHAPDYGKDRSGLITACTLVSSSVIWISTESLGTYCFDGASSKWSKIGDWSLPFKGPAEYVPNYKLWFGVLAGEDGLLCTSDLTQQRPVVSNVFRGFAAPDGTKEIKSHLLHLGGGQFCVAKLFKTIRQEMCDMSCCLYDTTTGMVVMFTGLEVQRCGTELQVVKHKSFRYTMDGMDVPQLLY
ncbi:hypothetical protein QYE76_065978 [Lolium multiflorum]|uniref:Uncharacterized protein n=1 Tax=Lolium multiflorum TaxID=4521 RepID=A0AAD8SAP2_LOLMU|nr:hypothetical protein QYE76_065978 [Lolium multiflorum]